MVTVVPESTSQQPAAPPPGAVPQDSSAGPSIEPGPKELPKRPLDIVFLQDATGSQGPYIQSAKEAIKSICTKISESASLAKDAIRFGLVAFRDHPPQDPSYVTKNFGFTGDVDKMKKQLAGLVASGGGDGPEASTAALAEALNMEWKEGGVKIVVLITDAPPHGLGEGGDGFPNGSPDQNDPLDIARQMAEHGISLYVIACEPALSRYVHAVDFYRALTQITSGRMVPLVNAAQLGDYIVGSAIETIETENLIGQYEKVILEDVYGQGKPIEEVMQKVQQELQNKNVQMTTLNVADIYAPSAVADGNISAWNAAPSLKHARGRVQAVPGSRIKSEYLESMPQMSAPFPSVMALRESMGRGRGGRGGIPRSRPAPSIRPAMDTYGAAPAASPVAAPMAPSVPTAYIAPQAVDQSQARRVVMQGLMRNAKVGPGGVLTPKGVYADKPATTFDTT